MKINFLNKTRTEISPKIFTDALKNQSKIFKNKTKIELGVILVGIRKIKKLNAKYRGINQVTDVLSFETKLPITRNLQLQSLGDIVICLPQAQKQARERKHCLNKELQILFLHGLKHLLGYHHKER